MAAAELQPYRPARAHSIDFLTVSGFNVLMTKFRRLLCLAALGLLAGAGCHSTPAPSRVDVDALAFIEVRGHGPMEVARAVSEAFHEASYMSVRLPPTSKTMSLVFEKPGSATESVVYGDWSGKVWYRVRIKIETPDPDVQLVKCDAYRVVGHGDPRFEEETKISFRKGPYQEVLDKAKGKLEN